MDMITQLNLRRDQQSTFAEDYIIANRGAVVAIECALFGRGQLCDGFRILEQSLQKFGIKVASGSVGKKSRKGNSFERNAFHGVVKQFRVRSRRGNLLEASKDVSLPHHREIVK